MQILEDAEIDNHIIALQEVTASKESGNACGSETQAPECDVVGDMLVLSGLPEGCFRRLVFCVEDGIRWSSFQIGYAHICMRFQAVGRDVLFVNVHLPHSGRPVNDFLLACDSVVATAQPSADKEIPIVMLGDLNYDLFRDDPASDRGAAVHAMLSALGLTVWPSCRGHTWRRRTIDYVICNDAFARMSACHSSEHRPWGDYAVRPDLREMLRVDHNAVVCDVLLPRPAGPAPGRRRRRVDWSRVPRRMCLVSPDAVAAQLDALPGVLDGAASGVSVLNRLAATVTRPRRALRYVDPPEVKELCRVRSGTVELEVRRRLSLQIVEARKLAKQAWKRQLYLSAASGNWHARKRLEKTVSLEASLWPMLLQLDGDRSKLVEEVKAHFVTKFSPELHCGDVLANLAHLPDVEPPFSAPEILECLRTMKMNKTTGMSKVSVELLKAVAAHEVGLASLRGILNDMLTWPELLVQCDLLVGWVILLPKKPRVSSADMLRPIVLGEVVVKLLTKLCIARLLRYWPAPACCLGSVRSRGVADAAYLVTSAIQEAVVVAAPVVVVKLDISAAYDSLKVQAVVDWLVQRWEARTGKSAKLLVFVLTHSSLIFHMLQQEWVQLQTIGTQQGATHSPVLFSYLVADQYQAMTATWEDRGETAAFLAGPFMLWGLWFVDDNTSFFRDVVQYGRLMPEFVASLRSSGLELKVQKTCTLGLVAPSRSPTLPDFAHVTEAKFVGVALCFEEGSVRQLRHIVSRAMSAFTTNRPLLVHAGVPRSQRLYVFQSLVTAAIRWVLCVLPPSATTARQLRVLHVTLMSWTLRAAVHASNPTPEGMAHSRHAVKLWIQVYSVLWDVLHVRMVWDWAGHVFRRGEGDLTYQAILHLKSHFRFSGARGVRTGPQNIGHKQLVAFLHRQGIHPSTAADRQLWAEYADLWVRYCGLCSQPCGEVMWQHNTDSYLGIGWVSVQGTFTGQEIWCLTVDGAAWCLSTLRRRDGWVHLSLPGCDLWRVLRVVVADLMPRTFYVRLLVEAEPAAVSSCKHACATSFELVREAGVVVEVSCLSCEWAAKVKAEVCAWHMSALPAA